MMDYVYIAVAESGVVKLGATGNPRQRLFSVQSALGSRTKIVRLWRVSSALDVERTAHALLKRFCLGRERYRIDVDTIERAVGRAAWRHRTRLHLLSIDDIPRIAMATVTLRGRDLILFDMWRVHSLGSMGRGPALEKFIAGHCLFACSDRRARIGSSIRTVARRLLRTKKWREQRSRVKRYLRQYRFKYPVHVSVRRSLFDSIPVKSAA